MAQRELSPVMDSLCNTANCQLCNTANCQLCIAARPELKEFSEARSESIGLQDVDVSPSEGLEGQWALSTVKEAVSSCLRTPIATVQVFCALP